MALEFNDIALFQDLSAEQRESMQALATIQSLQKNEIVTHEGEPADDIYFLLDGKIELTTSSLMGSPLVMDVIKPGDLFGWSAFFEGSNLTATSVCSTDVKVAKINGRAFFNRLMENPEAGMKVMVRFSETIARRLKEARSRLAHLLGNM